MKKEIELDISEFIGLKVLDAEGGSLQFDKVHYKRNARGDSEMNREF